MAKRNFAVLTALALSSIFGLNAQNVSRELSARNVLLEDFTGYKCGNCPDGHKIANTIALSHPTQIYPVSIHAGLFASPAGVDAPDFRTAEGTVINDYYNVSSYPSGLVNRRYNSADEKVQGRSRWTTSCREQVTQTAEVNVWAKASYDQSTKTLSADVELYYTADVADGTSALCVSLLQSNIKGPQAGSDQEDLYSHNHVLRAMFTPVWGDTIASSTKGTLVTKHYEYTVPEEIGNIATNPLNFDIVAYVLNPEKEVMNVGGCKVSCPGMTLPLAATLESYKLQPSRNYGYNFFECYLVNNGTEPLTSATFKMTFDDEEEQEYNWTASADNAISYRDRGYVSFPVSLPASVISGGCDYTLTLTALNGQAYAGNTVKGSFGAMINVSEPLKAVVTTDNQAADNTFRLLDADGNVVATYGPFTDGEVTTNDITLNFPKSGVYCFEVADAWGNGILTPRGNIKIYDASNNIVVSNNGILDFGWRTFFNCTSTDGIHDITADRTVNAACYDLFGRRISKLAKGQLYIVNGKKLINTK